VTYKVTIVYNVSVTERHVPRRGSEFSTEKRNLSVTNLMGDSESGIPVSYLLLILTYMADRQTDRVTDRWTDNAYRYNTCPHSDGPVKNRTYHGDIYYWNGAALVLIDVSIALCRQAVYKL